MTVYGLRHISQLRERNARIHRLSADVDTYERNKFYLKELEKEYAQLQAQLVEVKERWNTEYVPAIEKRQLILSELDFARNHTDIYYARVAESLRGADNNWLKAQIAETEQSELQNISCVSATAGSNSVEKSRGDTKVRIVSLDTKNDCESQDYAQRQRQQQQEQQQQDSEFFTSRSSSSPRHYRSWNLSDTSKRVDELETVRTQIKSEMGAIGAQTCALSVKLRRTENEIASLRNAMSLPQEHLYVELKRELAEFKIEGMRRLLRMQIQNTQPEPRLKSQATVSSSNAPSLAYSIGTISTDISSIGLEFLKATQSSLCDIEARFL